MIVEMTIVNKPKPKTIFRKINIELTSSSRISIKLTNQIKVSKHSSDQDGRHPQALMLDFRITIHLIQIESSKMDRK